MSEDEENEVSGDEPEAPDGVDRIEVRFTGDWSKITKTTEVIAAAFASHQAMIERITSQVTASPGFLRLQEDIARWAQAASIRTVPVLSEETQRALSTFAQSVTIDLPTWAELQAVVVEASERVDDVQEGDVAAAQEMPPLPAGVTAQELLRLGLFLMAMLSALSISMGALRARDLAELQEKIWVVAQPLVALALWHIHHDD